MAHDDAKRSPSPPQQLPTLNGTPFNLSEDMKLFHGIQNYVLPGFVEAARMSWVSTAKPMLITASIFSLVSTFLLSTIPTEHMQQSPTITALSIFAYASLLLNIGTACSGVLILDNLGTLAVDAANLALTNSDSLPAIVLRGGSLPPDLLRREKQIQLLGHFGIDSAFKSLANHLMACFMFGSIFLFVEIGIWVWVKETTMVAGTITVFLVVGAYGLLHQIGAAFWEASTGVS